MKYWIYKDSRILGPFDKDAMAGVPGLDAATLVSAGESAAVGEADWRPAGELVDLASLPSMGPVWAADEAPSTYGLLDKLQIDTAGLIADGEFPGAGAELFKDAGMKQTFGELLAPRAAGVESADLRRAKDRIVEMTDQLAALHRRLAEIESGQSDLGRQFAQQVQSLKDELARASEKAAAYEARAAEAEARAEARVQALAAKERAAQIELAHSQARAEDAERSAQAHLKAFRELQSRLDETRLHSDGVEGEAASLQVRLDGALRRAQEAETRARAIQIELGHASMRAEDSERSAQLRLEASRDLQTRLEAARVCSDAMDAELRSLRQRLQAAAKRAEEAEARAAKTENLLKEDLALALAAVPKAVEEPARAPVPEAAVPAPIVPPPPASPPAVVPQAAAQPEVVAAVEPAAAVNPVAAVEPAAAVVPAVPAAPPAPAEAPAPRSVVFERKAFRVVPAVKTFRAVEPEAALPPTPSPDAEAPMPSEAPAAEAPPPLEAAPLAPLPEIFLAPAPPAAEAPAEASEPPAPAMPEIAPIAAAPAQAAPPSAPPPAPPASHPDSVPAGWDVPVTATSSFSIAHASEPIAPPATLTFGVRPQTPAAPSFAAAPGDFRAEQSPQEVLARLAKPEPQPTFSAPRPPRNNKLFLIGGGALAIVMAAIGSFLLRHPKDLKQMAELDDGRSRVGAEAVEEPVRPPIAAQPTAEPPVATTPPAAPVPAPAEAAPPPPAAAPAPAASAGTETTVPSSQAKLDSAIEMVKQFPLDGGRGSLSQWLQYSYFASPGAGKEAWSANQTADKTYLVNYRFTPSAQGAAEINYLFEADMERGFVIGKTLDAKRMLAGNSAARQAEAAAKEPAKSKSKGRSRAKPAPKAKKRARGPASPVVVPLLPLPTEKELHAPSNRTSAAASLE